jgi:hypothetical protein
MKIACTGKVTFVKDDKLIVAIDVGMEMNHGYCTTPDGRDRFSYICKTRAHARTFGKPSPPALGFAHRQTRLYASTE